MMTIEK
jgi:hypothetical protein